MTPAPNHPRETERLHALRENKILDTPAEIDFDEITKATSLVCDTPISLFSLIDSDRQWIKSKFGLPATFSSTHRDVAFCAHTILTDDIFCVSDTAKDQRFADNPLVVGEPHICFYAGIAVRDPLTQLPIGALCAIDHRPRVVSRERLEVLVLMKNQIQRLLTLQYQLRKTRKSENEQLRLRKQLEEAQRLAKIGSWQFDLRTFELSWSTEHYRIFEIAEPQPSDLLYQKYRDRIHPDDRQELDRIVSAAIKDGVGFKYNHRVFFNDERQLKYVQGVGGVHFNSDGEPTHISGTCQDLTEKVLADEALELSRLKATHASRLASLGEMSAGIAHEINNPLAIITGTLSLLTKFESNGPKTEQRIETLTKAVSRISKIVNGLKKFSRSADSINMQPTSIAHVVRDVMAICEVQSHRFGTAIDVEISTEAETICDALEIEQVVINLSNNAIDAVKSLNDRWIKIRVLEEPDIVVLQVEDSGQGIPKPIEDKLFQPFFTTKPIGEGTGLGLSICKGILDHHGATISLNKLSRHTCFEVRFKKHIRQPAQPF